MKIRLRRAVFLALLALGALGLLATGSGVWSGSPWPWFAVLGLGVAAHVAGDHYDQRLRLERRTERRLRAVEEGLADHRAMLTPEGVKHIHGLVERMAKDLGPIKEEFDSLRTAGGLRSLLKR
jgi:hypothetical protein